jgi:hypothetical protein
MKSNLIDLTLQQHHETERAILVSDDADREQAVWLPKSQIEVEPGERGTVIVTLPEPLAIEKGLV